jgi:hypothetical protein
MNNDLSDIDFRKRGEAYRRALTYAEKMVTCITASIDACDHEDIERADHFSKMALRHAMQAEKFLAEASG